MLPCGHNFCKKCVISIIDSGISFSYFSVGPPNAFNCPLCQANINLKKYDIDTLPVNRALESIVDIYRKASPVDVFDSAWNADIEVAILNCNLHKLPQDRFCDSCNVIVCKQCEKEKHHGGQKVRHRVESLRQASANYQVCLLISIYYKGYSDIKCKHLPVCIASLSCFLKYKKAKT